MTQAQIRAAQRDIKAQLAFLHDCSLARHGQSYLFSPCIKDDCSKRRLRLVKTFWSYQRMKEARGHA